MASRPINSWQIEGEKVEAVTDFIFLGSKITEDSDGSREIKRHLFLGRKAMTNLESILKGRDFVDKGLYSKSYGFSSSHVMDVRAGPKRRLSTEELIFFSFFFFF